MILGIFGAVSPPRSCSSISAASGRYSGRSSAGSLPKTTADVNVVTLHPMEALLFEVKFSTLVAVSVIPVVAVLRVAGDA